MLFRNAAAFLLHLFALAQSLPTDQQPLQDSVPDGLLNVRAQLFRAEIIPTVIDDFLPLIELSVTWDKKNKASLGNTLKPKKLQDQPAISLHEDRHPDGRTATDMTFIVALTDPDAPSRDDPKWSEMCHWIATNVSLSEKTVSILPVPYFGLEEEIANNKGKGHHLDELVPYKPPGPPPKTGKHRYVFLVFGPRNGTTSPLNLTKPKDRQHWGTGEERKGVRQWAAENGLVPIGANFIYAQNKKQ
ncbi:PEBP-like protein [Aaosphaeria arxii CBS 175.79]|uniref:PEBP-like protein n=1 Tax=Aaosphaeria arxii CBS 175.79 TaxID=1450172 RepID=A0A6A5XAD5_9PLEO|nr:PEBP-like protein [Aaosphaeria arxii CBS 175.79]KAF2009869.1 PEBP-like protein [Aaosphaeria arxii CBS 175.79]